jgi:thioredoxin reductase
VIDLAIVGAGPFGLSLAAHLKARRAEFRIFGKPMETWQNQMPRDMMLKSEGFASSLFDPDARVTLGHYCQERQIPYSDIGLPVHRHIFVGHGLDFQKRLVPDLEDKFVIALRRMPSGFQIGLDNGETFTARRVVAAIGICHFQYVPPVLAALPNELVSHSSDHTSFERFQGREVTVVGGGASATDVAAALHLAGAQVRLVARQQIVHFLNPPGKNPRPLIDRLRAPMTGLGPGWKSLLCTDAPLLFHKMPQSFRLKVVRKHLGPSGAWFMKEHVIGHAELHLGVSVTQATAQNGRVLLKFGGENGATKSLTTDHVIAGTGYQVDLRRLTFLDPEIQSEIESVERTPVLRSNFESSIPGLYFVGASAANSFGPLLRFAYGAGFTARRLSKHLTE